MSRPQARVATVVLDVIAIGFWFAMGQPPRAHAAPNTIAVA